MTMVFEQSVVCPVMIGRAAHVQALSRCVTEARKGQGQTVLVAGEAGVGKSRLVVGAKAYAGDTGLFVLHGNCFEPDRTLPYAPLLDLLRGLIARQSAQAVLDLAGPAAPELARLLPELDSLLPAGPPAPTGDPAQEKRRLIDALSRVFVGLAATAPLLVVVEDLHWSDDVSLEFLLHLARRARALPLLLLCTYRHDEVQAGLQHFLAGLDRERLATEIALPRLQPSEVDAMLRAIFGLERSITADFLHLLYELTEGNPFFIEETLKSLNVAGDITFSDGVWERKPLEELRIPRTVQDAVGRRTALLTAEARQVLALAAVAGRRFEFDLLQQTSGLSEQALLARIKELIGAQLVIETSHEQFAFRHALTRQAVYAGLLARERRALHHTIAQTLERLHAPAPDAHLADLAYHFFEAGEWAQALEYAQRAGERALALFAPRAAIEQLGRAASAARNVGLMPSPDLYRARGLAYETLGDFDRALADYEMALGAARESTDRREEWRAMMSLGALWAGRDYARTGEWYRQATDLARSLDDPDLHAHSLNWLGNWLLNAGRPGESLSAHQTALDLFTGLRSQQGMAETLDLMSMTYGLCGDVRNAVARANEAIDLFRSLGDRRGLSSCLAGRTAFGSAVLDATQYSALRPPRDCERDAAEALDLARQIAWPAGQAYAGIAAGQALVGFGQLGAALAYVRDALRTATEIEHQQWIAGAHCTLGEIYLAMLAPDPAAVELETALPLAQSLGSALWVGIIAAHLVLTYLLRGDLERAEAAITAATGPNIGLPAAAQRRLALARAQLALAQGHGDTALQAAQELIDSVPGAADTQPIPAILKVKGEALMALGRLDEAEGALTEALQGAMQRSALPLVWQVYRTLGRLYRCNKREDEAERADAAAREIVAEIAATIDDEPLRNGFLSAALDTLPKERPLSPLRAAKQSFDGLTAREREVAALVGHGRSNREIAAALVLSERTVATHVGSILAKLNFTSRAQIAVWARDKGLL